MFQKGSFSPLPKTQHATLFFQVFFPKLLCNLIREKEYKLNCDCFTFLSDLTGVKVAWRCNMMLESGIAQPNSRWLIN
jgi:hypothetical protein